MVWNVYVASSWTFRQLRWRVGAAAFIEGIARVLGVGWEMEEKSVAVGARRTTFLDWRLLSGRDGLEKGGLRMPNLGVIMNF